MPKLPPPPRIAQKRSGFSSSLAGTISPVGGHHVGGEQVVDSGAVLAHQPADAAAEGEAGDAGVGDDPADRREPEELRLAVELAPEHAGLGARGARRGVDSDPLHRREVDHEAAVADGVTADVVAAAADGDEQVMLAREADRGEDVGDAGAAGEQAGRRSIAPFQIARAAS